MSIKASVRVWLCVYMVQYWQERQKLPFSSIFLSSLPFPMSSAATLRSAWTDEWLWKRKLENVNGCRKCYTCKHSLYYMQLPLADVIHFIPVTWTHFTIFISRETVLYVSSSSFLSLPHIFFLSTPHSFLIWHHHCGLCEQKTKPSLPMKIIINHFGSIKWQSKHYRNDIYCTQLKPIYAVTIVHYLCAQLVYPISHHHRRPIRTCVVRS